MNMNRKQSKIEKVMIKLLLKKGTQFKDPYTGEPITTKMFVQYLVAEKKTDLDNFLAKLRRKRK